MPCHTTDMNSLDFQHVAAIASIVLLVIAYYPYIRDIYRQTTKPHLYTWIVWTITGGTATLTAFIGGGAWGAASMAIGTVLVLCICALSIPYGTKNITSSDTIVLLLALSIVPIWWFTQDPYYALFLATAIDTGGYIPTLRKTWVEPSSETPQFWLLMAVVSALTILSLGEWNWLTVPYMAILTVLNTLVLLVCLWRQRQKTTN
jgi:hypothetical protein